MLYQPLIGKYWETQNVQNSKIRIHRLQKESRSSLLLDRFDEIQSHQLYREKSHREQSQSLQGLHQLQRLENMVINLMIYIYKKKLEQRRHLNRYLKPPERYEITRRSLNQTVGKTTTAVRIPKKCIESRLKPAQFKDVPGNSLVRLSPSKIINSTQ